MREFVEATGIENLGKRLVNSKDGKVEFDPPKMNVEILLSCAPYTLTAAAAVSVAVALACSPFLSRLESQLVSGSAAPMGVLTASRKT